MTLYSKYHEAVENDIKLKFLTEGLKAEYWSWRGKFDATFHRDPPDVTSVVPHVFIDWGENGRPHSSLTTSFGAKFTGYLKAPSNGTYKFSVSVDDEAHMLVDNEKCIDSRSNIAC